MQTNPNHESFRIITFAEQQLELMCEDSNKLYLKNENIKRWQAPANNNVTYHLESGQILLPPDVFLIFGSHGSDHIVEIHNNMYKWVQQGKEGTVATWNGIRNCKYCISSWRGLQDGNGWGFSKFTWCKLQAQPYWERHAAVVNDMQGRYMLCFLTQYEKQSIEKFCEFRYIIPPADICHLKLKKWRKWNLNQYP